MSSSPLKQQVITIAQGIDTNIRYRLGEGQDLIFTFSSEKQAQEFIEATYNLDIVAYRNGAIATVSFA